MGKYTTFGRQPAPKKRPWDVHPVWRGIGCLLLIIVPILGFAMAHFLIEINNAQGWLAVPREMSGPFTIPRVGYTISHFYADLLITAILLLLGFAAVMIIYSLMYRVMGPSRYSPMDAPPIRGSRKRR